MENTFSKDRNTVYKYIAFFYLDRTITKAISGNALARAAFKSGLVKRTGLIHALYLSLVFKLNFKDQLTILRLISKIVFLNIYIFAPHFIRRRKKNFQPELPRICREEPCMKRLEVQRSEAKFGGCRHKGGMPGRPEACPVINLEQNEQTLHLLS